MAARGCRIGEESRSTFWLRRRVIIAAPEDDDVLEIVNGAAHDILKLEISRPVAGDVNLGNKRDPIFVPARSQMAVLTQEAEAGSAIERRARRRGQRCDASAPPAGTAPPNSARGPTRMR